MDRRDVLKSLAIGTGLCTFPAFDKVAGKPSKIEAGQVWLKRANTVEESLKANWLCDYYEDEGGVDLDLLRSQWEDAWCLHLVSKAFAAGREYKATWEQGGCTDIIWCRQIFSYKDPFTSKPVLDNCPVSHLGQICMLHQSDIPTMYYCDKIDVNPRQILDSLKD